MIGTVVADTHGHVGHMQSSSVSRRSSADNLVRSQARSCRAIENTPHISCRQARISFLIRTPSPAPTAAGCSSGYRPRHRAHRQTSEQRGGHDGETFVTGVVGDNDSDTDATPNEFGAASISTSHPQLENETGDTRRQQIRCSPHRRSRCSIADFDPSPCPPPHRVTDVRVSPCSSVFIRG